MFTSILWSSCIVYLSSNTSSSELVGGSLCGPTGLALEVGRPFSPVPHSWSQALKCQWPGLKLPSHPTPRSGSSHRGKRLEGEGALNNTLQNNWGSLWKRLGSEHVKDAFQRVQGKLDLLWVRKANLRPAGKSSDRTILKWSAASTRGCESRVAGDIQDVEAKRTFVRVTTKVSHLLGWDWNCKI